MPYEVIWDIRWELCSNFRARRGVKRKYLGPRGAVRVPAFASVEWYYGPRLV